MKNNNVLAELAKELKQSLDLQLPGTSYYHDRAVFCTPQVIDKAQRIISELAKVQDVTEAHQLKLIERPNSWQAVDAIVKCRAIAEEREE